MRINEKEKKGKGEWRWYEFGMSKIAGKWEVGARDLRRFWTRVLTTIWDCWEKCVEKACLVGAILIRILDTYCLSVTNSHNPITIYWSHSTIPFESS